MIELHVVALSGGKDSTAMALRLAEVEPRDYTYICTPTGRELPDMFDHWRHLGVLLGKPVVPVVGGSLFTLIRREGCIPNFRQRFCTRMLKIQPYAAWLCRQAQCYDRIVSYVGLRADEEEREGGDYADIPGVEMRFPLREWGWGIRDVLTYLSRNSVTIPPRTDCDVCFFQRLSEWYRLWLDHPDEWAEGEALEAEIGHTFRSPGRDTWPTSMEGLRLRFEAGDIPARSIARELKELQCRVCRL
jgi:3'-phosphoadenosine 5'-phosphosulfate sulfotransferase (PAPS reductase)/FAD synthetase